MGSWKYVAAAAALLATPLAAQDAPQQTVEGAQEFLRLITTQFNMATGSQHQATATSTTATSVLSLNPPVFRTLAVN
jgi:hypothetical protein